MENGKNLINLNEYIKSKNLDTESFTDILLDNNWLGQKVENINNEVYLNCVDKNKTLKDLDKVVLLINDNYKANSKYYLNELEKNYPDTFNKFIRFVKEYEVEDVLEFYLLSFLLHHLLGEIKDYTDIEIEDLLDNSRTDLSKRFSEALCGFICWVQENYKTIYRNSYVLKERQEIDTDAYEENDYLQLMYKLFNEKYIEENDMYSQACDSKNYVDAWLFLSLHFICALRKTDLIRLPHPKLTLAPEETLEKIKSDEYEEKDARAIVYSIMYELEFSPLKPHKTERFNNVANIKFFIPESSEVFFGKLFAIAEAHFQINNCEGSLIRIINNYKQITRYMGDDIGELFINNNFSSRKANKSYMQMIERLTDEIYTDDEFNVKGYMLASLARSHKSSYGEFAKTTSIYLKDAKMNGYSPQFVARELFERGPLSFMVSLMLNMVTENKYSDLNFQDQTKLIKAINFTPLEVENSVDTVNKTLEIANKVVNDLYEKKEDILTILHRIGNGQALSKNECSLCLMTAMRKFCPYQDKNCISCEYEIGTKSTMILMSGELQRLLKEYKESNNQLEKNKNKYLAQKKVMPAIQEMLTCLKNQYGQDAVDGLEKMLEIQNG